MYQVILYYNFAPLDPARLEIFCRVHRRRCASLNLKGRVFVASEGINGTLSGASEDIEAYKKHLCSFAGLETTEFKQESCDVIPYQLREHGMQQAVLMRA